MYEPSKNKSKHALNYDSLKFFYSIFSVFCNLNLKNRRCPIFLRYPSFLEVSSLNITRGIPTFITIYYGNSTCPAASVINSGAAVLIGFENG